MSRLDLVDGVVFVTDADAERTRSGWQVFLWLNYCVGFLVTPAPIGMVTL